MGARQLSVGDEPSPIKQVVDEYMQPFLTQNNAPGAIVGVSIHGRREFFQYGTATDGSPFTPTTLVEIGSCTKVFTTTLLALAIARHQIEPDQSAQLHMPRGFTLQAVAQQVTPRQLAEFISGMPDDPTNLPRQLQMRSIDNYTVKDFLRWIPRWQPASPPPADYLYSNAGIGLLSYLVADATGTLWEAQLNNGILGPLGMIDTEMRPMCSSLFRHRPLLCPVCSPVGNPQRSQYQAADVYSPCSALVNSSDSLFWHLSSPTCTIKPV